MLDTYVTITLYGTSSETMLEDAFSICAMYENMLSKTRENSDIYKINNANGASVKVSRETAELIKTAVAYYDVSDGRFDITIGGVTELWDFKGADALPADSAITEALKHVGSDKIIIDGDAVRLSDPETRLDLGAVAKGYIADKIAEFLRAQGVSAIIDLGGNILTVGTKPNGEKWGIGIQKPFAPDELSAEARLWEKSVVSSGAYERGFYIGGDFYHHILNPETGYPYESDILSVTVFSEKSVDGDALSTAVFCMGAERGLALIESLPEIEALIIPAQGEPLLSSGLLTEMNDISVTIIY